MKLTLAAYKTEYSILTFKIDNPSDLDYYKSKGYVQLTEPVEVDFPELPEAEVISNEIDAIENTIAEEREQFLAKVELLNTRKAELLALTLKEQE